ncbi:MAG: hypothetical protein ACREM2_05175 [Vulcanimicrobiaceae bacterium]
MGCQQAGWCEVDTVAHCGGSGDGEFVSSVNATDIASTWTETRAVLGNGQRHVVAALEENRLAMPFALRGLTRIPAPSSSLGSASDDT